MTILLYVRRKGWPLESVTVRCTHERVDLREQGDVPAGGQIYADLIKLRITLQGELDDEQKERIARIAERCPIRRTLTSTPKIEERTEVVK
jgi:putative redox protein